METRGSHGLETHGSFCVTIPLQQILEISLLLTGSNRNCDRQAKSDFSAPRNLDVCLLLMPRIPIR